jgi:hypothetical protein
MIGSTEEVAGGEPKIMRSTERLLKEPLQHDILA